MANKPFNAISLIAIILGATGFSFGTIALAQPETMPLISLMSILSAGQRVGRQSIVVGIWQNLTENKDTPPFNLDHTWVINFSNPLIWNENYISLSDNNVNITFLRPGIYKLSLKMAIGPLNTTVDYAGFLLKNYPPVTLENVVFLTDGVDAGYLVQSEVIFESDGNDRGIFYCSSVGGTKPFSISQNIQSHLIIEYLGRFS